VRIVLLVYVLGAIAGVVLTDAKPLARIGLALAWPIGPLAFVTVVASLLLAALYIFPLFGVVVGLGIAAGWWMLR
jgi:hypothetical protein